MELLAYFLMIVVFLVSIVVSMRFRAVARRMSEETLSSRLSGHEIAQRLLADHGLYDVKVVSVDGFLSDHYNPANKTVNLSPEVYHGRSVLAAAVAAHECGHAIQHAKAYSWLEFRSTIVKPVSIASGFVQWIILAGIIMINMPIGVTILGIGIVLFSLTTLFAFITLPVEFDASKRALVWLNNSGLVHGAEMDKAKKALNWAASTYVVAAISSLATLVYYIMIFLGRRD